MNSCSSNGRRVIGRQQLPGGGGGWRGNIGVEGSRKGKNQERKTTEIILVPLVRTLDVYE